MSWSFEMKVLQNRSIVGFFGRFRARIASTAYSYNEGSVKQKIEIMEN